MRRSCPRRIQDIFEYMLPKTSARIAKSRAYFSIPRTLSPSHTLTVFCIIWPWKTFTHNGLVCWECPQQVSPCHKNSLSLPYPPEIIIYISSHMRRTFLTRLHSVIILPNRVWKLISTLNHKHNIGIEIGWWIIKQELEYMKWLPIRIYYS